MASNVSHQLSQWMKTLQRNPHDTMYHIDRMEAHFKSGWDEEDKEEVVCELLRMLRRVYPREHRLCFEEILLWVCSQISPSKDMIRCFLYFSDEDCPHIHAFEELLIRYEGPVLPLEWFYLRGASHFSCYGEKYIEMLLGYDYVIDVDMLRLEYEEIYKKS